MNKNKNNILYYVKGCRNFPPEDYYFWSYIKYKIENIINSYGYNGIKTPLLEYKKLFYKSIGINTDIIQKQIYYFNTYFNKRILCLKPENTVSFLKYYLNNKLFKSKLNKFWYSDFFFRHETPQNCRYREFFQIGLEVFNDDTVYIELELIIICCDIFKYLGIINYLTLEINTLGLLNDRLFYKFELLKYLKKKKIFFNNKNYFKFIKNPFKFLDSKDFNISFVLYNSPKLFNYISFDSFIKFKKIKILLKKNNIKFIFNKNLIRGIDYYNDFIFEWFDYKFFKNSVVGGGRYNFLSCKLGFIKLPACGLAIGYDRIFNICKKKFFFKKFFDLYILYNKYIFINFIFFFKKLLNLGLSIFNKIFNFNLKYFFIYSKFFKNNFVFSIVLDKRFFLKFNLLKLIYINNIYNKNIYKRLEIIISIKNLYKFFIRYKYKHF